MGLDLSETDANIATSLHNHASVMKLVDMTDSKSVAARRVGSSPTTGTTL